MRALSRLASAWDRLFFAPIDPLPLGALRISLGATIVLTYVALFPSWARYFAVDGAGSLTRADLREAPLRFWTVFDWTAVPIAAWWWLGLAAAIAFTVGFRTRAATIVLAVLQTSMNHRNWNASSGEDQVFRTVLLWACFAPMGATLSIDAWRRARPTATATVWPLRALQLNVLLIYVFSVVDKLWYERAWRDGTAMYWILNNELWGAWPFPELLWGGFFVSKVLTFFALAVEGLFPVLIWFSRTRYWMLASAVALHVGIALVMRHVAVFSLAMMSTFWAFVPADDLRRGFALVRVRGIGRT